MWKGGAGRENPTRKGFAGFFLNLCHTWGSVFETFNIGRYKYHILVLSF
jgi:hypothetical protein